MAQKVYIMGIGGTAMGSFAGLLKAAGYDVCGSDQKMYPPMSDYLKAWNIQVFEGYDPKNIITAKPDLVVVGNVIRKDNVEILGLENTGIPKVSFPQAIKDIFLKNRRSLVVAGTHGKTTASTMLAWTLFKNEYDPSFLIGGIGRNFDQSFRFGNSDLFVIEGDEYDTVFWDKVPKFYHYQPNRAIITSIEFDHADIYKDLSHIQQSFKYFSRLIPSKENGGVLIVHVQALSSLDTHTLRCDIQSYGINEGNWLAKNITYTSDKTSFTVVYNQKELGNIDLKVIGTHNVENAVGVYALCHSLGLSHEQIYQGLSTFLGAKRRQELIGTINGISVYDDFAHHPTAVSKTLEAFRNAFPHHRLIAIFEPRSATSSRNIFQKEYAKSFDHADIICIANVGKSNIPVDQLLSVKQLAHDISLQNKIVAGEMTSQQIIDFLLPKLKANDIVIIMSNGGFDNIHYRLIEQLSQHSSK